MKPGIIIVAVLTVLAVGACGGDGIGPQSPRVQVAALAGDVQFGLPGELVGEPLQVVATDPVSEQPVAGVRIEWTVVGGSAAVLSATSTTDSRGVASTELRLGSQLGAYQVEARAERMVGSPAGFTAHAVERPIITDVTPGSGEPGDVLTISGSNFNPFADYNSVLFDGLGGRVLSATATQLTVVVPACVRTHTTALRVALGGVVSEPYSIATVAGTLDALSLAPGAAHVSADPAELACLALPGGVPGASYLVVPQNAATIHSVGMPFELTALSGSPLVALLAGGLAPGAEQWEARLRERERAIFDALAQPAITGQALDPQLGERRAFRVLTSDQQSTVLVTAEVRAISLRAIIFVDLTAPAGGFTTADLQNFGQLFDDPIYPTVSGVFGAPSDIDANSRVIILLTPRVNALTPRGSTSYTAAYFYGCDLVSRTRCADTNSGEIFYSLVPDPQALFGDARSAADLLRNVPPVLAHEFQHMISFAQRAQSLDALWLSEAIAHSAEDLVGDVFAQRGDATRARDFRRQNYLRAHRYLSQVRNTSLLSGEEQGTVEMRGGVWLLVRYLRGHFGGNQLLARLTQTTLSSTQNVTAQTGKPWTELLAGFGLALYADGATELAGVSVPVRFTFPDFDPRTAITQEVGSYPLQLTTQTLGDGGITGELPSASSAYLRLDAPSGSSYAPVHLVFSGLRGGAFRPSTVPQLSIMRLR
ncbi:MAG TPA: IPT/TIG domain-containing protein [Longimicrobiales bacterium]|nr:IPT/TIG domain-containing protein [Longimicrobiales bacterium]